MQEALLRPAHPVAFGFGPGPGPLGFGVRRLCSPSLLLPSGVAANPVAFGFGPSPLGFGGPRLCSPGVLLPRGDGVFYGGGCTPFTPSPTRASPRGATSPSTPSSSGSCVDDDAASRAHVRPRAALPGPPPPPPALSAATEHRLRVARLALQYQDAANRYQLCVSQLADTAREAAALRVENAELRVANNDLAGRFAMLGGNQGAAIALSQQLRRLHLGQMQPMPAPPMLLPMALPASQAPPMLLPMAPPASQCPPMLLPMAPPATQGPPMLLPMARPASQAPPMPPMARPASPAEKLAVLPKSISIRSTGYLQMTRNNKHRAAKSVNVGSQRVIVGVDGAKPEAEEQKGGRDREKGQVVKSMGGLEFEVYCQGMFKTELCNKWEEAGSCNYGGQCQFAHGIAELRPVIRHPRYKTQPCRMVIGGAGCPYGHRCHFRHSTTPAAGHQRLLRA